jgi:hypothetical protein
MSDKVEAWVIGCTVGLLTELFFVGFWLLISVLPEDVRGDWWIGFGAAFAIWFVFFFAFGTGKGRNGFWWGLAALSLGIVLPLTILMFLPPLSKCPK